MQVIFVTTLGEVIDVVYTVVNAGPDSAPDFTGVLPDIEGLAIISATPSDGSYDAGTRTWSLPLFAVGTETLTVKFQITSLDLPFETVNLVIASNSVDSDLSDNTAPFTITNCTFTEGCTESLLADFAAEQLKELTIQAFAANVAVSVAAGVVGVVVPQSMTNYNLTQVTAAVDDKGITGSTTFQVRRRRQGVDVNMLSAAFSLADDFTATGGSIDAANDDILSGDILYVDVATVHTTSPNGLFVGLQFLPA